MLSTSGYGAMGDCGVRRTLESHDSVISCIGVGGIHRRAEAAVLSGKVVFCDSERAAARLANRDPDVAVSKEVHQLLQWRHSNTLDLGSNVVFDQRRGLHHQDDSGLMPGLDSSLCLHERESGSGGVFGSVCSNEKDLCHYRSFLIMLGVESAVRWSASKSRSYSSMSISPLAKRLARVRSGASRPACSGFPWCD